MLFLSNFIIFLSQVLHVFLMFEMVSLCSNVNDCESMILFFTYVNNVYTNFKSPCFNLLAWRWLWQWYVHCMRINRFFGPPLRCSPACPPPNTPLSEWETHMSASIPCSLRCSVLAADIGISISSSIFLPCQHSLSSQGPDLFTYSSAMSFMGGKWTWKHSWRQCPHVKKCMSS